MTARGKDQRTGVVTRVRRISLCGWSTPRKGVLVPRPKSRREHISTLSMAFGVLGAPGLRARHRR
jgi:hypothetical protein